jgi:hypothetical protein
MTNPVGQTFLSDLIQSETDRDICFTDLDVGAGPSACPFLVCFCRLVHGFEIFRKTIPQFD